MRNKVALCCLAACLLITACGRTPTSENVDIKDMGDVAVHTSIKDLLHGQEIAGVAVPCGSIAGGETAFAPANAEEKEMILDLLFSADIGRFEAVEDGEYRTTFELQLQTEEGVHVVRLGNGDNASYLVIMYGDEQIIKTGPAETFPLIDLNQAATVVRTNITDADNVGTTTGLATGKKVVINKANTANAKCLLDMALESSDSTSNPVDVKYDVKFEVNGAVYQVEFENGYCTRMFQNEVLYAKVEKQIEMLKISLGASAVME